MSGRFSLVVFSVFVLAPATPAAPAAFEAVANSCATRRRAPLGPRRRAFHESSRRVLMLKLVARIDSPLI